MTLEKPLMNNRIEKKRRRKVTYAFFLLLTFFLYCYSLSITILEKEGECSVYIKIDFNSEEAIYMQLRNQIVMGIAREQLHDGESLPSVRQLANSLGVNMHTVNKAYAMLRQEGYLSLDRRKGAVVSVQISNKVTEVEAIHSSIQMICAQAICKEITCEDMHNIINEIYSRFDSKDFGIMEENEK